MNAREIQRMVKQFQLLMTSSLDAICILDLSGIILAVNEAFCNLYGWNEEEIIGKPLPVTPEGLREETTTVWQNVVQGMEIDTYQTVRHHKNNQSLDVRLTISGIRGVDDKVIGIMEVSGVAKDLTQDGVRSVRRQVEYRSAIGQYQVLFDRSEDIVFELNLDGKIFWVNSVAEHITGYRNDELIGYHLELFLDINDQGNIIEHIKQSIKGYSQTFEYRFLRKDQLQVCLAIKTIPIYENDQVIGVYCLGQDITSQKRVEWRLDGHRKILEMITSGGSNKEIFQTIVEVVEEQSDSLCSIMLVDEEQHLKFGAGKRLPEEYIRSIDGVPVGENVGSCGTAAYRKEIVIVTDIATNELWKDYKEIALQNGLRSCWSIPILSVNDKVLGTFAIYNSKVASPDYEDITLLESYGKLASIAIEQKRKEEEIQFYAYSDTLTGLPNRRLFLDRLSVALHEAHHHQRLAAVMFLDMDRFKSVNDSLGHDFGDRVLKKVALRLLESLQEDHTLARLGGDEFTILLPEIRETEEASKIASHILELMREPIRIDGYEFMLTISIGIAFYPGSGEDPYTLMKNADAAMYASKSDGRNNFRIHMPAMNEFAYERLKLENDLRLAIEREEFFLHYQPLVHIQTQKMTSTEALIRWNHPVLGMIPPADFISLAEETGLIIPLGAWILQTVCKQIKTWEDAGFDPVPIAVNISALQFQQDQFVDHFINLLREFDVSPERIEIEITETTLMRNEREAAQKLLRLKEMGIKVSLDDFGTGYATLSFLKNFPIDSLKIERSFIQDITDDLDSAAIVSAVITLGHARHLDVIAEGVEYYEQLNFLSEQDCDEMQGYLFCRPISAEEFETEFLCKLKDIKE